MNTRTHNVMSLNVEKIERNKNHKYKFSDEKNSAAIAILKRAI